MTHKTKILIANITITISLLLNQSYGQLSISTNSDFSNSGLTIDKLEYEGLSPIVIENLEVYEFEDHNISRVAKNSNSMEERRSIDLLLESSNRDVFNNNKDDINATIGQKYFNLKDYERAQVYLSKLSDSYLSNDQNTFNKFQLGYTYLVQRNFESAKEYFFELSDYKNEYQSNSIYYLGICQYYLGDKNGAIASFESIQNHKKYKKIIPYYLSQIHFQDQDYNKVIEYAKSKLSNPSEKDKNLINRIVGLSYLAMEDYSSALPYLESYASETPKLTENEFYQIAILNYRLGYKEKATEYFKELSYQDSKIGQISNYLLGSIFIDLLKKKDAQSAFKQAAKLNYDSDIAQESDFLYYKLAADLQQERIAINGLSKTDSDSKYFSEAQEILADVLRNTEDYNLAQEIIESLPYKSSAIQKTYKTLTYNNGLRELKLNNFTGAISLMDKSITTEGDHNVTGVAYYWKAYAYNKQNRQNEFLKTIDTYLNSGNEEYQFESYYMLAYDHIQRAQYDKAIINFENAITKFNYGTDEKSLFDDAIVRLADLQLVNNNYTEALEYYDLAIENDATESDYILYQKAMLQGVNNQQVEKLTNLEKLLKEYPHSEYRDDALFQIAEALVAVQKNNEAFQIYNKLIIDYGKKSPYTATSYLRQGLLSYNSGDMYAALNAYKNGMRESTNELEKRQALIAIEEIYINELNDSKAYFAYTDQIGGIGLSDITKDSLSYEIGKTSYKSGEYEKAISQLEDYLKSYPSGLYSDDANFYLGDAFSMLKKYSKALPYYEKVVLNSHSPNYNAALKNAAIISYNHNQDFEKSYNYYDKLLIDNVDENNYLEAALYSAFVTKNKEGIIKYGDRVIAKNDIDNSIKSSAHFYLAKTYLSSKENDKALPHLQSVVQLSNNHQAAESSYLISEYLYNTGLKEKAEAQAFNTSKTSAAYPYWVAKSIILIGDIYVDKHDNLNASAAYESVIENFKENEDLLIIAEEKLQQLNKSIQNNSRIKTQVDTLDTEIDFIPSQTLD